jgi:hypothetical protein
VAQRAPLPWMSGRVSAGGRPDHFYADFRSSFKVEVKRVQKASAAPWTASGPCQRPTV